MKKNEIMKWSILIVIFVGSILFPQNTQAQITVEMEQQNGIYYLQGKVNGLNLKFIFDTGASNVSLSLAEALFMLKNGYIARDDIKGGSYAQIANGDIVENTEVILKSIEIGGVTIYNVKALISHNLSAPLLLGQSAIQKLGPIQLDKDKLIIQNGKNFKSEKTGKTLYQRAFQLAESGQYTASITTSEEALKYTTDQNTKAYLYDNMAFCYKRIGKLDKSIDCENLALGENLAAIQPAYNLGVYLFESNRYEEAENAFKNFVSRHRNIADQDMEAAVYAYLGDTQRLLGEVKDAEDSYRHSLQIKPHSQAYLGLGDLFYQKEDFLQAAENYKKGIDFEPNRLSNIDRYYSLGLSYFFAGDNINAYSSFKSCQSVFSVNQGMITSALTSNEDDIKKDAAKFLQRAMMSDLWMARTASNPSVALTHFNSITNTTLKSELIPQDYLKMANAYDILGHKEKSIETIEEALSLFPEDINIMFEKTLSMEDNDIKIDLLKKILSFEYKSKPKIFDWGTVYNNLAWTYCCLKKYNEGLPYAEQASVRNPEHGYIWETLGELYYNTSNYIKCIETMTKCLSCEDGIKYQKDAFTFRGNSYLKLGKKKEGEKDINNANKLLR
jgi:clan AA aspartic protease (TIGR02281 family)